MNSSELWTETELAQAFAVNPEDYPTRHIERNILMPTFFVRMGLAHLSDKELPKLGNVETGCGKTVNYKECSYNPKKVSCPECREYASMQHYRLMTLFSYSLGAWFAPLLREELETMIDYHMGHSIAFKEPFTVTQL